MTRWAGESVFCLASGPSLTADDIATVQATGWPVVAVNSTWQAAPFCDVIFAGDRAWWRENVDLITIDADRVTYSQTAAKLYDLKLHKSKMGLGFNSGMLAIDYALAQGAGRVILLGYDCSVKNGIHHHGEHRSNRNPTQEKCHLWQGQFQKLRDARPKADIVNCSRYTELHCFPVTPLEFAVESIDARLPESQTHPTTAPRHI